MKGDQKLISVIIPAYNAGEYIKEALGCVISQEYDPLEIIVVDDGSTDGTDDLVAEFKTRVSYTYQENSGPAAARNLGLRLAKGSLITFLDADDLWPPGYFDLQLRRFRRDPSAQVVLGNTQQLKFTDEFGFKPYKEPLLMLSMGGAMFRKSAFDQVGLFDESLLFCEDLDWFLRARELGISMIFHKDITHIYRMHDLNLTSQKDQLEKYQLMAYKMSLDRRRKSGAALPSTLKQWTEYYETKK